MSGNKKRSFLADVPSWAVAGLTCIASILLFFVLGGIGELMHIGEDIGEPILYIIYGLFIAVSCFFIVRKHPESVWFVPFICNAFGIFIAVTSANFWLQSKWIYFCTGWALSIIASILGAKIKKSKTETRT